MADLLDLLEKSSRTFALSIPLLPSPTREQVTTAYLLFRIADTLEDAADWSRETRLTALADFSELLNDPKPERAAHLAEEWCRHPPLEHRGYLELLRELPAVLDDYESMDPRAKEIVKEHLLRTSEGMADFVSRSRRSGELELHDLSDLRKYCYFVAGIVGEMLTELFLLGSSSLHQKAEFLRDRSSLFGEGLQLTNILKDVMDDRGDGRSYMPASVPRETVFELARSDLTRAAEYVGALQGAHAPRGLVAFNALPVLLARATLDLVEERGPGSKISRPEVFALVDRLNQALDRGEPAVPVGAAP